jgi:hypothetical protein
VSEIFDANAELSQALSALTKVAYYTPVSLVPDLGD